MSMSLARLRHNFHECHLEPYHVEYTKEFLEEFDRTNTDERDPIVCTIAALSHHRHPPECAKPFGHHRFEMSVVSAGNHDLIFQFSPMERTIRFCGLSAKSVGLPLSLPICPYTNARHYDMLVVSERDSIDMNKVAAE